MLRCLSYRLKSAALLVVEGSLDDVNVDNFLGVIRKKLIPGAPLIIDFSHLELVSENAVGKLMGLTIELKERESTVIFRGTPRKFARRLEILRDMPGFFLEPKTRRLTVGKAFFIGHGKGADVYRLQDGTILKLYRSEHHYDDVYRDLKSVKNARAAGVPVAVPAEIVKIGRRFGALFRLKNAETFKEMILSHKENIANYGHKFARLLKAIHKRKGDPSCLKNKEKEEERTFLDSEWMSGAERASMAHMISLIPEGYSCIAGDFHPGNVMVAAGELVFLDMSEFSMGHPYQDLAQVLVFFGPEGPEPYLTNSTGLSKEERERFLQGFLKTYFENLGKYQVEEQLKTVRMFLALRSLEYIREFPRDAEFYENLIREIIGKY